MILSWSIFILLGIAIAGIWFWQDSMQCREAANQAAAAACENMQLQFLDGTVAFARLGLVRGRSGWLALKRTYVFDYTADSMARRQGFIVMQANTVESIGFASHDPTILGGKPQQQVPDSGARNNVLYLDQWRRNHRKPSLPPPTVREERGGGDSRH